MYNTISLELVKGKFKRIQRGNSNKKLVVCYVNFETEIESREKYSIEQCIKLCDKCVSALIDNDQYFCHIQLFTHEQNLHNIMRFGEMYDIFLLT